MKGEHIDDETAALVLAGGLPEEKQAAIDAHVDGCSDCFELLASLAATMTPPSESEPDAEPVAPPRLWTRGSQIGRYVLKEQVGIGGMGTVFSAEDPALTRTIAIKIVRTGRGSNDNLLAEARMMAQLSHPNVVPVYDVGTQEDFVFLAMELIDGANLRQWMTSTKRTWREIQQVFLEAGHGLVAAHRAKLVHRDFKPDNVLVGKDGRVVVTDFGLAHSTLSPSDRVAGTLVYMSPEQRAGEVADAKSDQFSFSVAMFEALTGERADGKNALKLRTSAPAWLVKVVERGMAEHPGNRFASMEELLSALARTPIRKSYFVVAALALALAFFALRPHAPTCAESVPAKLGGAWDAERRAAIHKAFTATGKPNAEDSWRQVEKTLDDYANGWSAMHVDACNAHTQSAELFDLRVACLDDRLAELRTATELFAHADPRVVTTAPFAAKALTPIAACGDTRALLAIKPPPPAIAAQVGDLQRELARAKALRDGGKLDDAVATLRKTASAAEATHYEPLEATALLQLGDAELANGSASEADDTLGRAALVADTARDDVTRARALTREMYAAGYVRENFARVPPLDAQVTSIIARLGGNDELEGDRLQTTGMIALAEHDLPRADNELGRAIALREKKFGPHGRRVAMSKNSHCLVLLEQERLNDARVDCTVALDIWREALGANHPDVSLALKSLGRIEIKADHRELGCKDLEDALAIEEAALAADHPTIAGTLLYLAECRDDKAALALEQRALDIRTAKLGADHPRTVEARAAVDRRRAIMTLKDATRR
jgi:tetratricopeptide (TPR) repeat protein/predicted Ser/Thr protein kinase